LSCSITLVYSSFTKTNQIFSKKIQVRNCEMLSSFLGQKSHLWIEASIQKLWTQFKKEYENIPQYNIQLEILPLYK